MFDKRNSVPGMCAQWGSLFHFRYHKLMQLVTHINK